MTWSLWRRWVLAVTLGELIGFGGIPALGGVLAASITINVEPSARALILYLVAVTGGLGEGAVLAWFQLRVLRDCWPGLRPRRWITATAVAAALAWGLGMLAPTLDDLYGLPPFAQVAIWVPAGVLILCSIGTAQAWALREVVENPSLWIAANVLGWIAGLPWTFALPALLPADAPVRAWIATFVTAGVLMGVTVGAVTGAFLSKLREIR